eukprot:scaffold7222_cov535-Prasinococcus_capsulatus_cf.AAC.15
MRSTYWESSWRMDAAARTTWLSSTRTKDSTRPITSFFYNSCDLGGLYSWIMCSGAYMMCLWECRICRLTHWMLAHRYGRCADESVTDKTTVALRAFNEFMKDDPRISLSFVPIGVHGMPPTT